MKSLYRKYTTIGVLSLAHMLNDLYSNYLPQMLLFLVVARPDFTATRAAALISAFTISSSIAQPFFGFFLDRKGKRWLVYVGTLWMSVMLSMTGVVKSYTALISLATLAGLGTAAFHPQASTMVNILSGNRKALILSGFVAFGNIGFALAPLLFIPLFQAFGLGVTPFIMIPGILVSLLLIFLTPKDRVIAPSTLALSEVFRSIWRAARELAAIISVIAIRSLAFVGLLTFLPLYFKSNGYTNVTIGYMVTIMLFSGVFGGILGGYLSDNYGRKPLIVSSLMISTPLLFAFFSTEGTLKIVFMMLSGAALLSSISVTVVAAQEAIPDNKAFAAGLSMGFAGGIGGLAVIILGHIADTWGMHTALSVTFMLPFVSGLIGLLMKSRPAARSIG
jgi:FSR family fosmidomycin resistance protein-like MFS transporter